MHHRKEQEMPKRGKNYKASMELYDKQELHDVDQALELVQKTAKAKFDETVEAHEQGTQREYSYSLRDRRLQKLKKPAQIT